MVTKIPGRMVTANTIKTTNLAREGTTDYVLTSNGTGADPAYEASVNPSTVLAQIVANVPIYGMPPVRQCALFGPSSSGVPSFLPSSAVGLSITSTGLDSVPLVVNFAQINTSFTTTIAANLIWSGLIDNVTNYLYLDANTSTGVITPGATTFAPDYRWDTTYSASNGQGTFSIPEMTMAVGNGTSAVKTYRVYIGEAVASGGAVVSTVAYAYCARARFQVAIVPATNRQAYPHNIGIREVLLDIKGVNITPELNYTTGMIANLFANGAGSQNLPGVCEDRNTASINYNTALQTLNRTTGAFADITAANWNWLVRVSRGW